MKESSQQEKNSLLSDKNLATFLMVCAVLVFLSTLKKGGSTQNLEKFKVEELSPEMKERLSSLQEKYKRYYAEQDSKKKNLIMTEGELKEMKELFVEKYLPIALEVSVEHNIPLAIIFAQLVHESNWGTSRLAIRANNFFAIKRWRGAKDFVIQHDDDPDDEFMKYESYKENFRDYGIFLEKPLYAKCFACGDDYKCWALELKKAGYATDDKYPEKIIGVIEENGFDELDADVYVPTF